jgi:soluble lytic murein transglycosylase
MAEAARLARHAWREGIDNNGTEGAFLARWRTVLKPADEEARFDRLAWTDPADAAHQIARLPHPARAAAEAWLALKKDGPKEFARATALPAAARAAPGFVLERARWLRRAGQIAPAVDLWHAEGFAAEAAAAPEHRAAFWAERAAPARDLLMFGDAPRAYRLANDGEQVAVGPATDAAFLAGFIALRLLHDPASAARHFETLAHLSHAAITSARAAYWSAQAAMALGHADVAAAATARAASWPTTFYGQLAAGDALPAKLKTLTDPPSDLDGVRTFLSHDLVRAAILLARWGMEGQAAIFLRSAAEDAPTASDRALAARLALGLGLPDDAVAIGRRAGVDGIMLPVTGWPAPPSVVAMLAASGEGVDPALALGIIRQESSFDPGAISPSGARGLMQLMPATAASVFRRRDSAEPPPTLNADLIADPRLNVTLGVAYLRELLDSYGNAAAMTVAAYNAGPHRVADWIAANGDPRHAGSVNLIDWIELIPFDETRNYVQRVLEARALYRARLDRPPS